MNIHTAFQLLLTWGLLPLVTPGNILFLIPVSTKSHNNVFEPLASELASRGHQVTVVSSVKYADHPNLKTIIPLPLEEQMKGSQLEDGIEMRRQGVLATVRILVQASQKRDNACHKIYQHPEVQDILKQTQPFDVIIANPLVSQCILGIVGHLKVPLIYVATLPPPSNVVEKVGNRFPPSFNPSFLLPFTHEMTFSQRVINLVVSFFVDLRLDAADRKLESIYKTYLPEAPSVEEAERYLSLILSNTHYAISNPRSLLPAVVEVGGMQTRPAKALPKDLEEFLFGGDHGFILVSFGSIIRADKMPEETKDVFLKVFSRLKQRVLWKWESDSNDKIPSNVKLSKWVPQQDVLGHKDIRLFITHGGLLSTLEATYHGVPMIGMPIFFDQDLNMKQAESSGCCLSLEILNITEHQLESAINKILQNPTFHEKAKSLSEVFRDQPQTPLERAVFWTEYVVRNKGAPHLQSSARNLNFWQYHSIDVLGFLALLATLISIILCYLIKIIFRTISRVFFSNKKLKAN